MMRFRHVSAYYQVMFNMMKLFIIYETVHQIKHDLIIGRDMPETRCRKVLTKILD